MFQRKTEVSHEQSARDPFHDMPVRTGLFRSKPQVAVHFKVETSAYKRHFGGRLADVENQATGLLIRALKQHIQFVDFVDSLVPE